MIVPALLLFAWIAVVEGQAKWYYDHWCGGSLAYLDDQSCQKIFPSQFDRDWTCPVPTLKTPPAGFEPETPYGSLNVDRKALTAYVNDSRVNLCLALTARVEDPASPSGLSTYNRYFCNGDKSADEPHETWSSSKIFAVLNAAGHLRSNESHCASSVFGLDDAVSGKNSAHTPLGDLVTVICSYDETAGYSSNSLSSYFHDIGWRQRVHDSVLHDWLQTPSSFSLGGNYGEKTPSDLSLTVQTPVNGDDQRDSISCAADKDPWPVIYENSISSLTAVELTRRAVLHRELPETLRFPGVTWTDVQTLLYGAEQSVLFEGQQWGGMTADTAVFLQSSSVVQDLLVHNPQTLSQGQWRIFSKLGAGYSSSRSVGEIVTTVHLCLPVYDSNNAPVSGIELTLSARGSVPFDSSLKQVESVVMKAVEGAMLFVRDNLMSAKAV